MNFRVTHPKNLNESILGANRAQQGQASIASEGNEMEMAASVVANEFVGHGTSTPRPFKTERVGHPEKLNRFLSVDVLEWYHPTVDCGQEEKKRKGAPPANYGSNVVQLMNCF